MAPKRKKAGQTRMDAAVDHMTSMGFSKPLVRKTVKDLLKVYGEGGWKFIEEDAYKVLIDAILEEQDDAETSNLLKDASSSKVASEDVPIQENEIASLTHNAESRENALSSVNCNAESSEVPLLTLQVHASVNVFTRTRKPCYGWISDDDDDDDDDNDTKFRFTMVQGRSGIRTRMVRIAFLKQCDCGKHAGLLVHSKP
ncbi:hypothetical protein M8C21_001660 [Ambrosia artemisiifolia]|uniref:WIYLD domain-containing protein n=1 Tax=Ambrosia artemisiifolia TaxID=4212 RepID=A0AAD5C1I7_AMBAR|nr:hypothetical protein M8C21_001660 [Ambrosia artemisiifolia]